MSNIKIIDGLLVDTPNSDTLDTLRKAIGNSKILSASVLTSNTTMSNNLSYSEIITESPVESNDNDFYSQKQTIMLIGNQGVVRSQREWKNFLINTIPSVTLTDHTFDFNMPPQEGEDVDTVESHMVTSMIQNSSYFKYEELTQKISTRSLPNYSAMQHYRYNDQSTSLSDLLSFNGAMPLHSPSGNLWIENYFNSYVQNSRQVVLNSRNVARKNSNIFLLDRLYQNFDSEKTPNRLLFDGEIKQETNNLDLSDDLADLGKVKNLFSFIKRTPGASAQFVDDMGNTSNIIVRDMIEWLNQSGRQIFQENEDELYMLSEKERVTESPMDNILRSSMLYGWLLGNSKTKIRNLQDMMDYKTCYRETIGFKIEKFLNAEATDAQEQTFYIFGDTLRISDTQIKYDTKYVYKISALTVVLGTEYRYTDLKHTSENGFVTAANNQVVSPQGADTMNNLFAAEITVVSSPSIKIVEIPLRTSTEILVGIPPNVPEVRFSNESGNPNELKIFLSHNFLETEEEYQPISNTDDQLLLKYYLSQDSTNGKIKTSYVNNSGRFAIYRVDSEPERLSDFGNNFLATTFTDVSHLYVGTAGDGVYINPQYSNSAQYTDFISPNKKYYYLFKALSWHGESSPPTMMYEVELVQTSVKTYIEVREYMFEEQKEYTYQVPMRRFIKLMPNPLQVNVNQDLLNEQGQASADNYSSPIELGELQNGIWGRKFKIRVTSKHTGKKVDINVVFRKKLE